MSPLSCKCAIGILVFMRMDTLYFVFLEIPEPQAGDAVSMLWLGFWPGIAFGGVPLRFDSKLTGRFLIPSIAKCN